MAKTNTKQVSAAERLRKYRAEIKADPIRYAEYLQKERERYQKRKEDGKIKSIAELSNREKRRKRKDWRKKKHEQKKRQLKVKLGMQYIGQNTPPRTPESANEIQPEQILQEQPPRETRRERGRKKVKRSRSAAYRTIEILKKEIIKKEKAAEKYRKRYERLKKKTETSVSKAKTIQENGSVTEETQSPRSKTKRQLEGSRHITKKVKKQLLYHNVVIEQLRTKYNSLENESDRQVFSKILAGNVLKKYRMVGESLKYFGMSRRRMVSNEKRSGRLVFEKKSRNPQKKSSIREKVRTFLELDINSRLLPGKRDTITRNKQKKQKRLLNDSLKNLHKKFQEENRDIKISYSTFLKLRPFWIVQPKVADRNTCVCKIHSNIQSMVNKLFEEGTIKSKKLEDCMADICCNIENKSCMYRECEICKSKKIIVSDCDGEKQVYVNEWLYKTEEKVRYKPSGETETFNVRVVVKEKIQSSLGDLIDRTNELLVKFCRHHFNIKTQYKAVTALKDNLKNSDCLIHIDFSENYSCKVSEEIQSMHFGGSRSQISLHTGVLYLANLAPFSFCSVSECTRHDPIAIWAHLKPVIEDLKTDHPEVSTVHFLSDGPTTQYRSKTNFYLLSKEMQSYEFRKATWNFTEASHGKGAPDGIGGLVKRTADRLVAEGKDIPITEIFMQEILSTGIKVKLYKITDFESKHVIPELRPVPGTMKLHQVKWDIVQPSTIQTQCLSCFCENGCICYDTQVHSFSERSNSETTGSDNNVNTSNEQREEIQRNTDDNRKDTLRPIEHPEEDMVGEWCVVLYDGMVYPGIIKEVEIERIEVTCMHRIGNNRYFWPLLDDTIWYSLDKIVSIIPKPEQVTKRNSRHVQIKPELYKVIAEQCDLN